MIKEDAPTMSVASNAVDLSPHKKRKRYSQDRCFELAQGRKIMSFAEFCGRREKK